MPLRLCSVSCALCCWSEAARLLEFVPLRLPPCLLLPPARVAAVLVCIDAFRTLEVPIVALQHLSAHGCSR